MRYLFRMWTYIRPQYKAVIAALICSMLTAGLFSVSIVTMLPLMRVMIGEEGPHGWIYRSLVKERSGIDFEAEPLREVWSVDFTGDSLSGRLPLVVSQVIRKTPAARAGIQKNDTIMEIVVDSRSVSDRDKILEILATYPASDMELFWKRGDEQFSETVALGKRLFYTDAADWLLSFLPERQVFYTPEEQADFKRDCILLIVNLFIIITILKCVLRFAQEYLVRRIAFKSIMQLRLDAYDRAVRLPLTHFDEKGISDTISRFVQDSNRIKNGLTIAFGKALREPFTILAMAIAAFAINAKMTSVVLIISPIAAVVLGLLGKKMRKATRRTLESWSRLLSHLQQTLLGIRIVKGYHREQYEKSHFESINQRLFRQQMRVTKIDAAGGPILETLGTIAACIAMMFAAQWMTRGELKTSDFFILVTLLGAMAESGRKLGDVFPRFQMANASAERVYQLVDTPAETDPPEALELSPLRQTLEMQNVCFRYPGSPEPTLADINLRIAAGETVAVVGPNGSGKTTLLSMIPRFFTPESGRILIDNVDIASVTLRSLREQIGIVTQQTIVFNDTIAANIAYGVEDVSEEEIIAASKQAYAHDFIEKTVKGYQTVVGEHGARLSGGQLQRLAIARAILRDPSILILDEAMSQIDSDSEAKIQKAITEFTRDRTSFIIAHRLSTIIDADRIVVMDRGRIVAQGNHKRLLESCSLYQQLYQMQFGRGLSAS